MKLLTGLALLTLTMNTAFAAQPKALTFTQAVAQMKLETFKGKTDTKKDCTATLVFEKDADGSNMVIGIISFLDYKNKPQASTVIINAKKDEVTFENDGDEEYRRPALTKTKTVPEPDNEGAELNLIETISQTIENGKLTEMRLEWYEINEHSDPHEDQLSCSIL